MERITVSFVNEPIIMSQNGTTHMMANSETNTYPKQRRRNPEASSLILLRGAARVTAFDISPYPP
jgi:hypothetical protein